MPFFASARQYFRYPFRKPRRFSHKGIFFEVLQAFAGYSWLRQVYDHIAVNAAPDFYAFDMSVVCHSLQSQSPLTAGQPEVFRREVFIVEFVVLLRLFEEIQYAVYCFEVIHSRQHPFLVSKAAPKVV
jgi:hypothetical protein